MQQVFYQRLHILLLCAVAACCTSAAASNAEGLQQCGFKTIHLRSPGGSTSISGDSKQPREGLGLLRLILSFPVLQQLPFEFFQLFSYFGKLSIQHFQLSVKFAVHSGRQWMYKSLSHLDKTSSRFCLTHSVLKCACVYCCCYFHLWLCLNHTEVQPILHTVLKLRALLHRSRPVLSSRLRKAQLRLVI